MPGVSLRYARRKFANIRQFGSHITEKSRFLSGAKLGKIGQRLLRLKYFYENDLENKKELNKVWDCLRYQHYIILWLQYCYTVIEKQNAIRVNSI